VSNPATGPLRLHAALVHFPVAAWSGAVLLRLSLRLGDAATLWSVDTAAATAVLIWLGLGSAAIAAAAGLVEYSALPAGEPLLRHAMQHMRWIGVAVACFLLLGLDQGGSGPRLPPPVQDLLFALGAVALFAGAHRGGRLVVLRYRTR